MGPVPPGLVSLLLLLLAPYLSLASVIGRGDARQLTSEACPAVTEQCPEFSYAPAAALKYLVCGASKNVVLVTVGLVDHPRLKEPSWLSPQRLLAVQVDLSDTSQDEGAVTAATDTCKRFKVKKVFDLSPSAPPRPLAGFADLLVSSGCDTHGFFAKPGHVIIVSEKPLNAAEADVLPLGSGVSVYRLPSHVNVTVPACFEPRSRTGRRPPERALLLADTDPGMGVSCQLDHQPVSLGCPICIPVLTDELKQTACTAPSAFIVRRSAERLTVHDPRKPWFLPKLEISQMAALRTDRKINIRVEERRPLGSNGSESTKCVQGTLAIFDDVSPGGIDTTAKQVNFIVRSHCPCEFLTKDSGYAVLLYNKTIPNAGRTVQLDESFTIVSLPKGVTKLTACTGSDADAEVMLGDQPALGSAAPQRPPALPALASQSCPICHSELQPDLYNSICEAPTVMRVLSLNPASKGPSGAYFGKARIVQSVRGAQQNVQDTFVYTMPDNCKCDYVAKPSRQYFVFMGELSTTRESVKYLPMTDQMHILAYSYRNARLLHDALSACPTVATAPTQVVQKRMDTYEVADQGAYGRTYGGASGPLYGSPDAVPQNAGMMSSDGYAAQSTGRSDHSGYGVPNYSGMPPSPSYDSGHGATYGSAPRYNPGPSPSYGFPTATAAYAAPSPSYAATLNEPAPQPPSYKAASAPPNYVDSTAAPNYAAPSSGYAATASPAYGSAIPPPTYNVPAPSTNYGATAVTAGYAAPSPSYAATSAPNYRAQAPPPGSGYGSATSAPSYGAASYGAPSSVNSASYGTPASVGYAAPGGYGAASSGASIHAAPSYAAVPATAYNSAPASAYGAQPAGYGSVPQPNYSGGSGPSYGSSNSYTPGSTHNAGSLGGAHKQSYKPAPAPSYAAAPAGGYGSSAVANYGAAAATYAPSYAASATAPRHYPSKPADYSSNAARGSSSASYGSSGHTGTAAPGYGSAANSGGAMYSQATYGAGSAANKGYSGSGGYNAAPVPAKSANYGVGSPSYGSASAAGYGASPSVASGYGSHGGGAQGYGPPHSGSYGSVAATNYGSAAPSGHSSASANVGSPVPNSYGAQPSSGGAPPYVPVSNAGYGPSGDNGASASGGYGGGHNPSAAAYGQASSPTYGSSSYGAAPAAAQETGAYSSYGDVTYVPPYGMAEYPPSLYQPLYPTEDEQATVISYVPTYAPEEEYYASRPNAYENGGGYGASSATYAPSAYAAPAYGRTYAPEPQAFTAAPYSSGGGPGYDSPYGTYAPPPAGNKPSYAAPSSAAYSAPSSGASVSLAYGSAVLAAPYGGPGYPPTGASKPSYGGPAQSQSYGSGSSAASVSYAPPANAPSSYSQPSHSSAMAVPPYAPASVHPHGRNYEGNPNSAGSSLGAYQPASYGSVPSYSHTLVPSRQNLAPAYKVPATSHASYKTAYGEGYPSHTASVSAAPAHVSPQVYSPALKNSPHSSQASYSSAPASSVTYSPPSYSAPSYGQASSGGGSTYNNAADYKQPQHSNAAAAGYSAGYFTTTGYGSVAGKDASYGMVPTYRSPSKAYDESDGRNPSYSAQPSASNSAPLYGKDATQPKQPSYADSSSQAYTTSSYGAVAYTTQSSGGPSYSATYTPPALSAPAYSQPASNAHTKAEAPYSASSGGAEYSAASYAPPSHSAPSYNGPSYSASSAPPTYSAPSYAASHAPPAASSYAHGTLYAAPSAPASSYAHFSVATPGVSNVEKAYSHTISPPIYPAASYAPPAYVVPSYAQPAYAASYAPPAYSAPTYFGAAAASPSYSQPSYVVSHAPPVYSAPMYAPVAYRLAPRQPVYVAPAYVPAAYAPSQYVQPAYSLANTAPLYPPNVQLPYGVQVYPPSSYVEHRYPPYNGPQYSHPSYNQPLYDASYAPPAYSAPSFEAPYAPPTYSAPSYAQPSNNKPSNLVSHAPPSYPQPAYNSQQYNPTYAPPAYSAPSHPKPLYVQHSHAASSAPPVQKAPAYGGPAYSQPAYQGTAAHASGAHSAPAYGIAASHVQYPAGHQAIPTYGVNAAYNQPPYPRSPQPGVTVSYNLPAQPLPLYYSPAGQPSYGIPGGASATAYGPAKPGYSPPRLSRPPYGAPASYVPTGAHGTASPGQLPPYGTGHKPHATSAPPSYSVPSSYGSALGGHGAGGGNGAYGAAGGAPSYGNVGGSADSYGQGAPQQVTYTTASYPSATPTYESSYTTSSSQLQYTTYGTPSSHSPSYTTYSPSSQGAYTTYGYSQPTYTTYSPNYSQQSYTTYGSPAAYSPATTYSPAPSYPEPDYESQGYNLPATYAPPPYSSVPTYSPPSHIAPSYSEPSLAPPAYTAATGYTTASYSGATYSPQGYSPPAYTAQSYPPPTYSAPAPYAVTEHSSATYAPYDNSAASYAPVVNSAPSYASYPPPTYLAPGYTTASYSVATYSPQAHSAGGYGEATYAPLSHPAPSYASPTLPDYSLATASVQPGYGRSVHPEAHGGRYALAKGLDTMYSEAYPIETAAVETPSKPQCPQAMPSCPVCAAGLHQDMLKDICNFDLVAEAEVGYPPQAGKAYGGMCSEMCIGNIFYGPGYSVMDKIRFSINKYCSCEIASKSFSKVIVLSYRHNWRAHGGSYGQLLLDEKTVLLPLQSNTAKAIQDALEKCRHSRRYQSVRTYADAAYAGPAGCPDPFDESCPQCANTMAKDSLVNDLCSAEYAAVVAIGLDYQKMAEYKNGLFAWKQAHLPAIQVTNETGFGKNLSVVIKVNGTPSENASTGQEPGSLTDSCMTSTVKALYNVSRGISPVEDNYDLQLFLNKQCPCHQLKSQIPGYAILVVDKQSKLSDGSLQLGTGAKLYPLPHGLHTLPPCSFDENVSQAGNSVESKLPLPELDFPVDYSADAADEGPCPENIQATCPVCIDASEEPAATITQYCKSTYAAVVSIPDDAFSSSTDSAIQPWWAPKISLSVVPYGSYAQINVNVNPKSRYQFPETDRTVGHADAARKCRSGRLHVKQEVAPGHYGEVVDAVKFSILSSCKCSFLEQPTQFSLLTSKQAPVVDQSLHLSEDVTLISLPMGKTELPQCVRPEPTKKSGWLSFW